MIGSESWIMGVLIKRHVLFLEECDLEVIYNNSDSPPQIDMYNNRHLYDRLPDVFCLTDPDLELNSKMPENFIEQLYQISLEYDSKRVGLALALDDYDTAMFHDVYHHGCTIHQWESGFWDKPLSHPTLTLYSADIDTTLALHNKQKSGASIRVAGDFTARHLPWYIHDPIVNPYDRLCIYQGARKISTISNIIIPYLEENFLICSQE